MAGAISHAFAGQASAEELKAVLAREAPEVETAAAGQVLLYVADEEDLLSEKEAGAIGLLDDTYLAHRCIAALSAALPQLVVPADYEPPDERSLAAVRSLLPAGVTDALDRTCDNLVRVAAGFFAGGGESPAADDRPPPPPLRVDGAVEALRDSVGN